MVLAVTIRGTRNSVDMFWVPVIKITGGVAGWGGWGGGGGLGVCVPWSFFSGEGLSWGFGDLVAQSGRWWCFWGWWRFDKS